MGLLDSVFGQKPQSTGSRILVVEDNEIDRKVVVSTLEKQGYNVDTAIDGVKGFEKISADRPDLIVMDCEMPEMGGVELCRKLKESQDFKDIPVVFLTSHNTPSNVLECFDADAENFLAKPLKPKVLLKEIEKILFL